MSSSIIILHLFLLLAVVLLVNLALSYESYSVLFQSPFHWHRRPLETGSNDDNNNSHNNSINYTNDNKQEIRRPPDASSPSPLLKIIRDSRYAHTVFRLSPKQHLISYNIYSNIFFFLLLLSMMVVVLSS